MDSGQQPPVVRGIAGDIHSGALYRCRFGLFVLLCYPLAILQPVLEERGAGWLISETIFPDMPCMKKAYKKKGVGTLVRSQERRAAAPPRINQISTAGSPRVYRGSTASFVPPSVYIGFVFFVLAKSRSGQLSRMPRRAKRVRWLFFWANRPVGVPSYPAPPRRCAVRRPAPTRPKNLRVFPGHALHAKKIQRQNGDGPLASSQERRALFISRIQCG